MTQLQPGKQRPREVAKYAGEQCKHLLAAWKKQAHNNDRYGEEHQAAQQNVKYLQVSPPINSCAPALVSTAESKDWG